MTQCKICNERKESHEMICTDCITSINDSLRDSIKMDQKLFLNLLVSAENVHKRCSKFFESGIELKAMIDLFNDIFAIKNHLGLTETN